MYGVIYNNLYAIPAQNALGKANILQGKVIEQLSTGLRINSASDDASGLAIAEQLLSQIKGLKRASMNAQDGISFLQSVEGAVGEVNSMLLRIRELAVQSGNPGYTANDRAILQLEVDQLKDEINRVSDATEFNTKKVLNGDATALWSSTKNSMSAIINGPVVKDANYKITAEGDIAGQNSIYKSNIMNVLPGTLVAEIIAARDTNLEYVKNPIDVPITGTGGMTITVSTSTATAQEVSVNSTSSTYKQAGSDWDVVGISASATINFSGYFELEILSDGIVGEAPLSGVVSYRYRTMDAKTGEVSEWITTSTTTIPVAGGGTNSAIFTINLSETMTATGTGSITFSFDPTDIINSGDKMIGMFSPVITAGQSWAGDGGGVIKISGSVSSTPDIHYSAAGSLTNKDNGDSVVDYKDVPIYIMNIDPKTGDVITGSITLEFRESQLTPITLTGVVTVIIRDEGVAAKDTKLKDLKSFYNADGVGILEFGQELTIYSNGKQATIYLESEDTIADLESKLSKAIIETLDRGVDSSIPNAGITNENLVKFISSEDESADGDRAVAGTIVMQTATVGRLSDLAFIGNEDIINALGLSRIQESENATIDIRVTDAHTDKLIGEASVNSGVLQGVIDGVEIVIDQTLGFVPTWNEARNKLEFIISTANNTTYFHFKDNRTELQIGANEGQTLNVSIGQLDTAGLEIEDLYVVDVETSQRAITLADNALNHINLLRTSVGSQTNRLEYAISSLDRLGETLTIAESRIRNIDIAEASTRLAMEQLLVQSATTILAKANLLPQTALTLITG